MLGKRLKDGSTIGLITPASHCDEKKLREAMENLKKMGYKVKLGKNVGKKWFSFGGSDTERAEDLNSMFKDPEVDGIMCIRGGYGSIRFLNLIDYDFIRENPKVFIGYSDITSLHQALYKKCKLVTYHGPMAVSNLSNSFNEITKNDFQKSIRGERGSIITEDFEILKDGSTKGVLVGGNLTTLISNLGTEYEIDYEDKILFLEDIGENTYKIDRMLNQLKNAKIFHKVRGVILGDFSFCEKGGDDHMELMEVFKNFFKDFEKPVIHNFRSGHCEPMITIPFGVEVLLDTLTGKLEVLEKYID